MTRFVSCDLLGIQCEFCSQCTSFDPTKSRSWYKKVHAPIANRSAGTNPPMVIVVMGPPKVGKTTLIKVFCGSLS